MCRLISFAIVKGSLRVNPLKRWPVRYDICLCALLFEIRVRQYCHNRCEHTTLATADVLVNCQSDKPTFLSFSTLVLSVCNKRQSLTCRRTRGILNSLPNPLSEM
ncbi:hypothetical protein CDAR_398521 [Caerostris darwini]|uniref:Uncharacterized protein n=1 Tax=Caerostris darwini TaxID=1538125 RepID=A0AAV4VFT5_9ARAC|nr:hypothetical protein CDAR_398521 [Caerostris darwini]